LFVDPLWKNIEQANKKTMITAYEGAQLDICEAFGISVPDGCVPTYKANRKQDKWKGVRS
jgi:hypothetical protein